METNETVINTKTDFFSAIAALGVEGNLNLTIRKLVDGTMVVITSLTNDKVGDNARKKIIPLKLTATPQELDKDYFNTITAPITKASGLMTNMEAYLKSVEEAAKKSRMEQDKKNKEAKEKKGEKEQTAENAEVYKAAMEKVLELEKSMKYAEALEALPTVADYPKREAELLKKRAELEKNSSLMTLFQNAD